MDVLFVEYTIADNEEKRDKNISAKKSSVRNRKR